MTATLTLTTPNSTRAPLSMSVWAQDAKQFTQRVAREIKLFAERKGIAAQAVEYELVRGRG